MRLRRAHRFPPVSVYRMRSAMPQSIHLSIITLDNKFQPFFLLNGNEKMILLCDFCVDLRVLTQFSHSFRTVFARFSHGFCTVYRNIWLTRKFIARALSCAALSSQLITIILGRDRERYHKRFRRKSYLA